MNVLKALLYAMGKCQCIVQFCKQNDQFDNFKVLGSLIKKFDNIFGNICFFMHTVLLICFIFAFNPELCEMDRHFRLQNRLNLPCTAIALWSMLKKRTCFSQLDALCDFQNL